MSNDQKHLLFLSHAGVDTYAAERLVRLIEESPEAKKSALQVWFDKRDLKVGAQWQKDLEDVIENRSTAFAVYIGSTGIINWVENEVRVALSRATSKPPYPLIPILTAKSQGSDALPPFARQYQGVKNVESDSAELSRLIKAAIGLEQDRTVQIVKEPFIGLRSYGEEDSHLFFGRGEDTKRLLKTLKENRMIMVVGDSGSGKSSLVRAGLIPAFRGGELARFSGDGPDKPVWSVIEARPGVNPFQTLADSVERVARESGVDIKTRGEIKEWIRGKKPDKVYDALVEATPKDARILMVIDQFEELFTGRGDIERKYIDCLLYLIKEAGLYTIYIVMTMRYDYYNLCSMYQDFYEILEDSKKKTKFVFGMLKEDNLRACIEKPLKMAGVSDCSVFVDTILDDIIGRPGDIALLQMALFESWCRRDKFGGDLLKAYSDIKGVSGALATAADDLYENELKDDEERALAKKVFLRLVHLGDGGSITKRIADKEEFTDEAWKLLQKFSTEKCRRLVFIKGDGKVSESSFHNEDLVSKLIEHDILEKDQNNPENLRFNNAVRDEKQLRKSLGNKKINADEIEKVKDAWLKSSHETAEISHDALATQWPKYQTWIWNEIHFKRFHDKVMLKARDWRQSGRKRNFLAKGNDLVEFWSLFKNRKDWLSGLERDFIKASHRVSLWAKVTEAAIIAIMIIVPMIGAIYPETTARLFTWYRGEIHYPYFITKAKIKDTDGNYYKYDNGIVYDARNDLEWYVYPEMDKEINWNDANEWTGSLKLEGGNWRMPTRDELMSLYKEGLGTRNMTPLLKTTNWEVWSGETKGFFSSDAWYFLFLDGTGGWDTRYGSGKEVFAVRSRTRW